MALVARITKHPAIAIRSIKEAVRASLDGGLTSRLRLEREMMALCFAVGNGKVGSEKFKSRSD